MKQIIIMLCFAWCAIETVNGATTMKDSNDFEFKYEGDVLPDAAGFIYVAGSSEPREYYNFVDVGIFSHDTYSAPGSQVSYWKKFVTLIAANGGTLEAKLKVIHSPDNGTDLNRGYWLSFGQASDGKGVILSFLNDKVMHRAGGDDFIVTSDNTDMFHIYRIILNPGWTSFDLYRDGQLVVSNRGVGTVWEDLAFGDPTGAPNTDDVSVDFEFIRWDSTGAYAPVNNGNGCNGVYKKSDFNNDCYVNFADFAIFAQNWTRCTDPGNQTCVNE